MTDDTLGVVEKLSQWVAVKVVYDNRTMPPHDIIREAAILQAVSHPNVSAETLAHHYDTDTLFPLVVLCLDCVSGGVHPGWA